MPTTSTRLIALDIDGTLLPPGAHHATVPDTKITDTIAVLLNHGMEIVLASGRMFPGTVHIAKHLGITLPLICQQGASTHELDGSIKTRYAVDQDIAREIVAFAQAGGWAYAWFDAERYLISEHNDASQHFADVSGVNPELHSDPQNSGVTATGVDIISSNEQSGTIHRQLEQRYGARLQLLDFQSVTAAHAPEATKGLALAALAAELGIPQSEVLAIGDSVNDESMLRWAGHSAAPEHCDSYAREAADEILQGTGIDGVTALLEAIAQRVSVT